MPNVITLDILYVLRSQWKFLLWGDSNQILNKSLEIEEDFIVHFLQNLHESIYVPHTFMFNFIKVLMSLEVHFFIYIYIFLL